MPVSASERPQTYASDRAAIGTDIFLIYYDIHVLSTSCTEQLNKFMFSTSAEISWRYLSEQAVNEVYYFLFVNKISVEYKQRFMQLSDRKGHSFCNFCIHQWKTSKSSQ
jgi:hypothetical protein